MAGQEEDAVSTPTPGIDILLRTEESKDIDDQKFGAPNLKDLVSMYEKDFQIPFKIQDSSNMMELIKAPSISQRQSTILKLKAFMSKDVLSRRLKFES